MRQRIKALAVVVTSALCFGSSAMAWNKAGHMVSGAIAYRDLKNSNPDVIPKVVAILKQHPEFDTRRAPLPYSAPRDFRGPGRPGWSTTQAPHMWC